MAETFRLLKEKGGRDFAEWEAAAKPAKPPDDRWDNFPIFVWLDKEGPEKDEKFYDCLKSIGIKGCAITGRSDSDFLTKCGMLFYVENTIRGEYLRMNRGAYKEQMERYAKAGFDVSWLTRPKSFFDASDREVVERDLCGIVAQHGPNKPMAYSLGDEVSYGCLVNPMDLDVDARAMRAYRKWLKDRYGAVEKLNEVWETKYASFDEAELWDVERTRLRALRAGPEKYNLAPWNDHLEFNDEVFAAELKRLVDYLHDLDPWTPVGIGGAQVPAAFGGYNWSKLATILDWSEPYYSMNIREVIDSFKGSHPHRRISIITIYPEREGDVDRIIRDMAYCLAEGASGVILWQSSRLFEKRKEPELVAACKGTNLRALLPPNVGLFVGAHRVSNGCYMYLNQQSIRMNWMLEGMNDRYWWRRFGEYSRDGSEAVARRKVIWDVLQQAGYNPLFADTDILAEKKPWPGSAPSIIVLSDALSLGEAEKRFLEEFVSGGGTIVTQGRAPGAFDASARRLNGGLPESLSSVQQPPAQDVALSPLDKGWLVSVKDLVEVKTFPLAANDRIAEELTVALRKVVSPQVGLSGLQTIPWSLRIYTSRNGTDKGGLVAAVRIPVQSVPEKHRANTIPAKLSISIKGVDMLAVDGVLPFWGQMLGTPDKPE